MKVITELRGEINKIDTTRTIEKLMKLKAGFSKKIKRQTFSQTGEEKKDTGLK